MFLMKRPESYRGLKTVGWGRVFPMTKWEKKRLDEAADYAEKLLAERIAQRKGLEMDEDLFSQIREALYGSAAVYKLALVPNRFQIGQSFDAQMNAGLSNIHGEMIVSLTVSREGDGVRVRRYDYGTRRPADSADRTTAEYGEEVVKAFVLNFIRDIVS